MATLRFEFIWQPGGGTFLGLTGEGYDGTPIYTPELLPNKLLAGDAPALSWAVFLHSSQVTASGQLIPAQDRS